MKRLVGESKSVGPAARRGPQRLSRLTAAEAHSASQAGALLVDVRSGEERGQGAAIPGAQRHALSVVLWRLDEPPATPG